MSRGFVKEGDQEDVPMVPPRAYLPAGVVNYVTPVGFEMLKQERQSLIDERDAIQTSGQESDSRVMRNFINAKLDLLECRLRTAKVVEHVHNGEIMFGSCVTFVMNGSEVSMQITGVDEATASKGKIPFTSPMAKALFGHHVGDFLDILLPGGMKTIKIVRIE